ncbi:phage tail length tape measure family protein [Caulobacter sp. UC70_42]|uniref:phage tail length tape measure family protein n=1 Tax=Caulobacter sp. UC70_42 TaxID=3374551 RepID=UPI0037562FB6
MADKDLEELAKGSKAAADAAGKHERAQKSLQDAIEKTGGAMAALNTRTTTSLAGLTVLEKQISSLTKAAGSLEEALSGVNKRLVETAGLSVLGAAAIDSYAKAQKGLEQAAATAAKTEEAVSKARSSGATAAASQSSELRKLGKSVLEVVLELRKGTDPLQVLIDKGPALWDVFSKARDASGGFRGMLGGIATEVTPIVDAIGSSLAGLAPLVEPLAVPLAGVAAAAAVAVGAVAITAQQIGKTVGENLDQLHLTEEQLERVKNKGVTMGDVLAAAWKGVADVLSGVWKSVADAIVGFVGPALRAVGDFFGNLYQGIIDGIMGAVKAAFQVVGGFIGGIRAAFGALPAAIGDLVISTVNIAAGALEKLANTAIGIVNNLIHMANETAAKLGIPIKLPELDTVSIGRLENKYAGAAASLGKAMIKGAAQGAADGGKAYDQMAANVVKSVAAARNRRVIREAGPAPKAVEVAGRDGVNDNDVVSNVTNNTISNNSSRTSANSAACACKDAETSVRDFSDVRRVETVQVELLKAQKLEDQVIKAIPQPESLEPFKDALAETLGHFEAMAKLAPELGKQLEAAFGKPGKAVGDLVGAVANFGIENAKLAEGATSEKRTEVAIKGYASMATAAKGFFKENSSGYAAISTIEKAYRAWQLVASVKATAAHASETAAGVAGSLAKATASAAAGAAKIFESLGPWGFPVVAAMVGVLAGLGLKSGGGGGSVPGVNDMKTRQDAQGTGSSLGDSKAKSDSLEKALGYAEKYQNKDLEYGNDMVRSLKSIDGQIGAVAAALARSFGAGGMLSTEGLSLGKTGASASLSNLGFSKSTTRTLQDQGIQFDAATLADITDGKLSGSTYQQVMETTKKKAFGITTSNKSKVITETGALDTDFVDQVSKLVRSLGKGVADAAKALGETDVESVLAKFKVDLGKLSFKDMTGTQIEEALNAIFGKLGDDMAKAAVPVIAAFQKVGEGAFETLVRVARQYEVIDTTLESVGMKFNDVGVASLAARERLVDLVGGLDNLTEQTSFFGENFLTDEERLKPVKDTVNDKLTELRLPTNMTREGFKNLVLGLDVSTREGAELYAAMMALAPAFDKVATAAEATKSAVDDKAKSIQDRIDDLIMTPAQKLAKSRTAEEDAVKALDASLLPLLKSLWAVEDAAEASAAAIEKEAKDKAMAASRSGALADLLDAQGYAEQAKKIRRDLALADVEDAVQQDYMRRTWAAQDAAEKVSAARDVLTQAYQREQDAIQATKDKFKELSTSLRAFSGSLTETIAGTDPAMRYRRSREAFMSTAAMARLGDPDAMGRLQSEGEAFTAASRDYVSTSLDYLRDVGLVRSAVDEAADTADRQVSIAQRQLDALDASVQGLIEINTNVVSVRQAIIALQAANAQARNAGVVSVGGIPIPGAPTGPPNTGTPGAGAPVTSNKTLDGLYNYDPVIAAAAYAESLRDPQYWANGNPYEKPGTQEYSTLQTLKAKDPQKYSELEYMHTLKRLATGGSFEVGGSGPPDSKFFGLALSPGEAVNVQRADQKNDRGLINELRNLRAELADLRASNARIAASNDKMERTLTNVTEGGRAMQTQAAA